jgi:putative ABC transport system permease protein
VARPRGIRRFLHLPRSAARIRADVDEELRFDIEMRASDLVRQGVPHDAAQARAVAEFGDLEATRRYCEETDMASEAQISRATVLSDLRADLAITWRMMRRTPAFALVVGTTLALGIGANTTVFSVVKRVLITPLPFRAPDRLYRMYTAPSSVDGDNDKLSAVEIMALADARSLAGVTEFGNYGGMTFTDGRTAEPWGTVQVGPNFFEVFGIRPALGRQFTDEDFGPNGARGVIITHQLWQRVFGGDPGVVGRRVQLNNGDLTIVGVLPESFVGPTFTADALLPLPFANILRSSPRNVRARVLRAVVRTRDGVSEAALNAELATLGQRVRAQYPEIKNGGVFRPVSLHAAMVGNAKTVLLLVMAGALLVLVITCANIAGLFLSRGAARRRELGVRAALGAGRSRLVRQMLTESALYGLGGGAAGIALAVVMTRVFVGLAGSTLPQLGEIRLDGFSLAFAATIAILCGLAVGVAPAVAATRVDLREALGDTGNRGASTGVAGVRGGRHAHVDVSRQPSVRAISGHVLARRAGRGVGRARSLTARRARGGLHGGGAVERRHDERGIPRGGAAGRPERGAERSIRDGVGRALPREQHPAARGTRFHVRRSRRRTERRDHQRERGAAFLAERWYGRRTHSARHRRPGR